MQPNEIQNFFLWWLASLFAAASIVTARLGFRLYGNAAPPPADPEALARWLRRRRWITIAEFSALPAFATTSVVLVSYYGLDPVAGVLIAMAEACLGFALLIDAAAWLFRQRIGWDGRGGMLADPAREE